MPVSLYRKVRFNNVYFGAYKEYLYGGLGFKIRANIMAEVSWQTESDGLIFTSAGNTIERTDGGSFISDGFENGDSFVITGTASNNFTYASGTLVVTDDVLYLTSGVTNEIVSGTTTIKGTTLITSIDFYPNLIENSSGFNLFHLTDRETVPRYSADEIGISPSNPTLMQVTTNSHGWLSPAESVIDGTTSCTIYKDTTLSTATEQIFVINHTFTITPLFLSDQLAILKRELPPATGALKDRFALKYVYTIDAKFDPLNPDIPHTSDGYIDFPKGQTGWYNEYVNGRPSLITKRSINYRDASNNKELTSIDYCKTTLVRSAMAGPNTFNPDTKIILHILYLPLDENEYINTRTDYKTNFIYECAFLEADNVVVQGENTGDYHFLKDVSAFSADGANINIDFTVDFSSTLVDIFDGKDENNLNYLIFVSFFGSTQPVSVIADINVYQCDKDDATLFTVIDEWQFFTYPNYCNGIGYSDFNLLPRDTIVAKGQFYIKAGTSDFPVILKNISNNIIVTDSVNEFTLESFNIDTSSFLPNCDNVQQIFFEQEKDYIVPDGSCANKIKIIRVPTLDITGYHAYEMIYPFKARWEEWRDLEGANQCFSYPTQNWYVYANQPGWSIKFVIKAEVESRGHITQFEHTSWGNIKDPCTLETSVDFETFDVTGTNSFVDIIAKDKDTFVKAYVYGDFTNYTADQLYGILHLDAWGIGGVSYTQEIGTHEEVDENYVWYGAGGSLKATLVKVSNTKLEISAYLNYLYLPTDTKQFILATSVGEYQVDVSSPCANLVNVTITFTCGELEIVDVVDTNTLVVSGIVDADGRRDLWVEGLVLLRDDDSNWFVTGGIIDGVDVVGGYVTGVMVFSPPFPYTVDLVGDYMQGEISGELELDELICGEDIISDLRTFNDGVDHFFNDDVQMSFNA